MDNQDPNQNQQQPEFNEAEYLRTHFGIEDREQIRTRLTDFETLNTNYTSTKTELDTLKPAYEQVKSQWDTLPEEARYVADLRSKGVTIPLKEIIQYHDMDPEKMDDESVIKLATKLRTPGLENKHIEAQYRNEFSLDPEDVTITDDQRNLIESKRIQKAADDKQFLKNYINRQFTPPVDNSRAEAERQATEATQYWQAQAPSIVSGMKDISEQIEFTTAGSKGEEKLTANYSFAIPDNDLAEITNRAIQAAVKAKVPNNEEGRIAVQQHIAELVEAKFGRQIRQAALRAQQTEMINFIQREFHNAGGTGGGGQGPGAGGAGGNGPKTREDAILSKFRNS